MRLQVTVTYTDGRQVQATVTPRAKVEFERKFDRHWNDFFEQISETTVRAGRLDWLYYLGFAALRAADVESLADYTAWLALVDDVDLEAQAQDPTGRAPTPAT